MIHVLETIYVLMLAMSVSNVSGMQDTTTSDLADFSTPTDFTETLTYFDTTTDVFEWENFENVDARLDTVTLNALEDYTTQAISVQESQQPKGNKAVCSGSETFPCNTGECIKASEVCNGKNDCLYGEDEDFDCGASVTTIFALISMISGSLFALLFMHMYFLRLRMFEDGFVLGSEDVVGESYRRYITLVETAIRMTEEDKNAAIRAY